MQHAILNVLICNWHTIKLMNHLMVQNDGLSKKSGSFLNIKERLIKVSANRKYKTTQSTFDPTDMLSKYPPLS